MTAPNRVAVVVGVGDVVGRACAVGLVQHVEVVVVIDPSEPAAKQAAVAVEEAGGEAMRHAADLTDLVAMERAAEAVAAHHPAMLALANCHCAIDRASIQASSMADWEAVVRTNVLGPVVALKAFLPLLERTGDAAVVNPARSTGSRATRGCPRTRRRTGRCPP